MQIAILIFDGLTALDAIGPYEVLSRLPGAELRFVAKEAGPKRTDTGALGLQADLALADLPDPDVVLVPGGEGNRPLMDDPEVLEWLRAAHERSTWTTSVCTGALVLGAAGILDGKRATTHWAFLDRLSEFGARAGRREGGRGRQGDHRRRGLGRDRHGPDAGRPDRRRRRSPRRSSSGSSTTRTRPSTPARPSRPPPRWSS